MRDSSSGEVISDAECREIVRKQLCDDSLDDYRLVSYEVTPIGQVNGYMGQYFALRATVASTSSSEQQTTIIAAASDASRRVYDFFAKIPPPESSPQYRWNEEHGSFRKEVEIYTKVFPELLGADIDDRGSRSLVVPRCFLGIGNDVIVLEDMTRRGFAMTDKSVPFDVDHCRVAMRQLAEFHARSVVFEAVSGRNIGDEFSECLEETLWPAREGMARRMFDAAVKGVVSMVDLLGELGDEERTQLKRTIRLMSRDHAGKLSPSDKFRNVLCHGDLWANNILFKYDGDGKPVECCLIDFQLARYNPPAHDIMCFLQFTTTRELRNNHLPSLLKVYWDAMAASLKGAELEASAVFSWDELLASIAELRAMCVIHGLLNIPVMLLEPTAASKYFVEQPELLESALYVDRTPLVCGQFHGVPAYKERMIDALLELHEFSSLSRPNGDE